MKILFADDNYHSRKIVCLLEMAGHEVCVVDNLADAEDKLTRDPGAGAFDAVILDLEQNAFDLPAELYEKAKNGLAGWIFYDHFIAPDKALAKRTILFSGFLTILKNRISTEEFNRLNVVDKSEGKLEENILMLIKKLVSESR